jgi:hypothetical protein
MEKTNVKVYFSATADDFSIEDFTNKLGVKPTRAFNKVVIATGTVFRLGANWELGTDYEESLDINNQLNIILSHLESKEEELNRLKNNYDLAYRFIIVIQIENNEKPAMYLDSRFIHFADSIGAEVEFDLYVFS